MLRVCSVGSVLEEGCGSAWEFLAAVLFCFNK